AASDAWITKEEWAAVADATVVVADGDDIVMFFDGSKSRDATALVGCRVSDGHVFEIGVWEPNPRDPKSTVPFDEVDGVVAEAFDTWNVVAFFADVREFESYVHTSWPEKYRDQLVLHAVPTGNNPGPIAWDMRSHTMEFTRAAETCREDIHGLRFTHDGSAVTARHVGNLKEAVNRWGTSVRKESPGSPNKIDAGVCVIGARMVRARLLASKEWRERDKKTTKRPGRVRGWQ
ncbi:MAG: Terminase, partial [Actinophytocola sp.]